MVGEEDACPWGRLAVLLCKCCGQPGANSSSDLSCVIAHAGNLQIARPRQQVQTRSSLTMSSASLVACGKERTGFPQASAAQPPEIQHPIDPEIGKRCYTFIASSTRMMSGTD